MGDASKVQVSHVSVAFRHPGTSRREMVLQDVSLDVGRGEFVSLIGPSGCGKTTLINVIAGSITPDRGDVRLDETRVAGAQWEKTAMMFARDTLLPWRTAEGNVSLALELGKSRGARRRPAAFLDLVGLSGYEAFYPSQLSQGMRQRVALARTLAADRDILLMDEPFAALDAQTKTLMQAEFMRIWESDRKTVLLVTHDLMEAIALSDRVVVMSPKPARIKAQYRIDIPRPRSVIDLPSDPTFHEIFRRLWDDLKTELPVHEPPSP